jgi:hypothetical protein
MARYPKAADVRLETQRPLSTRSTRNPQHTWFTDMLPWQQVPVMIAPVKAGETLKSASIQCRCMSSPLVSGISGWWLEFYLFYVRVGDLPSADVVRASAVDPTQSLSSLYAAASAPYYHNHPSTVSWANLCHQVVSRSYFRKEGQNWNDFMVGNYPGVQIQGRNWSDSLYLDSELGPPSGADTWNLQWSAFQAARSAKLTTATWEEYLAMAGVAVPPQLRALDSTGADLPDYRIPELVRFVRDFAYPVPTVDPATGLLRTSVQWSLAERVDKRRYFAEPGFLFALMVARPKSFSTTQTQSAVDSIIQNGDGFLPDAYDTDPHSALVKFTNSGSVAPYSISPMGGSNTTHWLDKRDLYLYGDQWYIPNTGTAVPSNGVPYGLAYPANDLVDKRYPTATDAHAVFVDTTNGIFGLDGICSLRIASRIGTDSTD